LISYDVNHGRKEFNFSTWNRLATTRQTRAIQKCWDEVEGDKMPPGIYVDMHQGARLSEKDRAVLREWSLSVTPQGQSR
jgi:hypothetical protein